MKLTNYGATRLYMFNLSLPVIQVGIPPSKHRDSEPQKSPKTKKKVEAVEMRGVGEPVYSGPTLPPLGPGERAEVEADMVSNPQQLILFWWGGDRPRT